MSKTSKKSTKRIAAITLGTTLALAGAALDRQPALSNDRVGPGELCRVGSNNVAICSSGSTCRPATSYNRRFCAKTPRECSVPNRGDHGMAVGQKRHVNAVPGVAGGQYVCIDPSGPDIPRLFREVRSGQCVHSEQCRFTGHECIPRRVIHSPGGSPNVGQKYCHNPSKCSGGYDNNARFTFGTQPWICHANSSTGGVWVKTRPDGKKAASKSGSTYTSVYGRAVSLATVGKYCDSGVAKRWVESPHWYCHSDTNKCVYPNTAGKALGYEVSVGGTKYRCQGQQGWRRADGESCSTHADCGVMSRCSTGPGTSGNFCRSTFKKCAWPGIGGLTSGQRKKLGNKLYKCRDDGTYLFLGGRKPTG